MNTALQLNHITKTFGKVIANHDINLTVQKGTIHCILGENGSGKSTLMNVIMGLHKPDTGEILMNGKKVQIEKPRDAMKYKIGMVHQHFMLFNQNTVLENIIAGEERCGLFLRTAKQRKYLEELIKEYHFQVNLDDKISDLSVGTKQKVEILRVLYKGADVLIFDEPTAVLTPQEADQLIEIIFTLKKTGKTILFISHKMNEILKVGDYITVLRKGEVVYETEKVNATAEKLAFEMVGKETKFNGFDRAPYNPQKTVLKISGAELKKGKERVSFQIREGEIVGIAGVGGNGQLELEELVVGLLNQNDCKIEFLGKDISNLSIIDRKMSGLAYIPSDRLENAVFAEESLYDNYLLGNHMRKEFNKKGMIQRKNVTEYATKSIEEYDVRTPNLQISLGSLSGGNQQKMVLSREISQNPKLIIAAQPTRGLDIGAIEFVHTTLLKERDKGAAILLISAELSEITELSDRVIVLYNGEVMAEDVTEKFTRETLGLLMAGKKEGVKE